MWFSSSISSIQDDNINAAKGRIQLCDRIDKVVGVGVSHEQNPRPLE